MSMKSTVLRAAVMFLFTSQLASGALIVQYQLSNLGSNQYRYTYIPTGYNFGLNQDLDIRFDPTLYSNLTNGVAPGSFDLAIFQPNNPPGVAGDYDPLSLVANPSLAGAFAVSFTYLGAGVPGSQPFSVNQFDSKGNLTAQLITGRTTSSIPEPGTVFFVCVGLAAVIQQRKRFLATNH